MRPLLPLTILVVLVLPGASPSASAATEGPAETRIIIRTYDNGSFLPSDRLSSLTVATNILAAAGLDVQWLACGTEAAPTDVDACTSPLAANELAIRFVRASPWPERADRLSLGYSIVDAQARSGQLATIYVDRTAWLARESGTRPATVLGRAVAHEVGHLLLGTTSHTRAGLMRAIWTTEALQCDRSRDWQFSASEARAMRDRVGRRRPTQIAAKVERD